MRKKNFSNELAQLARVESLKSLEFRVQFLAVLICIAIAIAATGLWALAVWFILHYLLVFAERRLANHFAQSASRRAFLAVISFNLAVGITFAWLPVYLWSQGTPSFYFAAMALLVGSTLNTFLIRSTLWYQSLCFVAPNAGAFLAIAISMSGGELPVAEVSTLLTIASAVLVYFLIAVVEMHRIHRSHEQTKTQLLQSQKNEVIGQLTGGVAHDFNNLLSVISGNLEIALSEQHPHDRDLAIKNALAATSKGATLVHQLLAFARKSRLETKSIPVDLALRDLEEMAPRVIPSNIKIAFGDPNPGLVVLADPALLTTALLNLILNSRDAISASGTIEVRAALAEAKDLPAGLSFDKDHPRFVLFTVKDTGCGMTPELLGRATEPFYTTKPIGFGSGLGLSMVQGFAQQSGGGIHIDSKPGVGTTVSLVLPVGALAEHPPSRPLREEPFHLLSGNVLIVEDQPEILQIITRLIEALGLSAQGVLTADAACELIDSGLRPDLLITDAVMPGVLQMSDLLVRVRSMDRIPKIIVMSGYDEQQIEPSTLEVPEYTFVQKPFRLSTLSALVKEKLSSPSN